MVHSDGILPSGTPTLQTVISIVGQRADLPPQKRQDIISACNSLAKWVRRSPDLVPVQPTYLRRQFADLHPAALGVSQGRINNVASLIKRGCQEIGIRKRLPPSRTVLSPDWLALDDSLDTYPRAWLSRFARYCSHHGIPPTEVGQANFDRYLVALVEEELIKNPRVTHQNACRAWNTAIAGKLVPSASPITVPRYEQRKWAAKVELPDDLRQEIDVYLSRLAGNSLREGPPRAFRPASLHSVGHALKRYLAALSLSGVPLADKPNLAACIDEELLVRAFEWMVNRNGGKTSTAIGLTAWHVRTLAIYHCGMADRIPHFIRHVLPKLRVAQNGLSEKNTATLMLFNDREACRRFLKAPEALWGKAAAQSGMRARLTAEASVLIDLLIHMPVRIQNLNTIRIDQHMHWTADILHIHFRGQEVKNGKELAFKLPRPVGNRVREFINRYRAAEDGNPYLFPGLQANPKSRVTLSEQITEGLFDASGIRLTPHQFRHVMTKILLDRRPGAYELVRQILGHKSTSTVYSHYAGAETDAAVELFDRVIAETRDGGIDGEEVVVPSFLRSPHGSRRSQRNHMRGSK